MKFKIPFFITLTLSLFLGLAARASYLYWQVGDAAGVDYSYAAVCVVDSNGNTIQEDGYNMWLDPIASSSSTTYTVTDLGIYSSSEYSFFIEFVNSDYATLTTSETMSYTALAGHLAEVGTAIPSVGFSVWVATPQAVPEPTGGLLVLLGAAMMALRRRRSATP